MSDFRRDAETTLFGSKRLDLVVFVTLLLGMLVASRELEVYSRMPADTGAPAKRTERDRPAPDGACLDCDHTN